MEYNQRSFTLLTLSICFFALCWWKEDQILGCRYISFENKVRNHITHLHYLQCQRQRLIYFIFEIIIISCGSSSSPCCISINIRRLNWLGTLNVSLWECLHQSLHYKLEERRKRIFSNAQISIFLLHKWTFYLKNITTMPNYNWKILIIQWYILWKKRIAMKMCNTAFNLFFYHAKYT